MPEPLVLALDIGTSSVRASLYDAAGTAVEGRFHHVPFHPTTTPDGGVEADAEELLNAVAACIDAVHAETRAPIAAVGVSTFWHGLLGFDGAGNPVTPLYLWADTRSAPDVDILKTALDDRALHARTGCHLHTSYWPAKLSWLARERSNDRRRVVRWGSFGELLELRCFGEAATSLSMASGTGLFDQERIAWDPEALAAADIAASELFPLTDRQHGRRGLRAPWASRWPRLREATWFPAVGDGAAGNIGSDCIDPSRIALNVGTSCALRIANVSMAPPPGLWRYRIDGSLSMIGGATSEGGNVYAWCHDVLHLPPDDETQAALSSPLAPHRRSSAPLVLPFLAGERSPGWRGERRGTITGLSLSTTAIDILRAMLEAVALRLAVVYDLLAPLAAPDHRIVASGGALARSPAWAQMIADAIGRPIRMSNESEASSRGAARLALLALGALTDLGADEAPPGGTIEPDPARHEQYRELRERQGALGERI